MRPEAERGEPVTPPGTAEPLATVPPAEASADPEWVERRWHIEEARARKIALDHAAAHRRARLDVVGVGDACAGVDRTDYAACPLDLLRRNPVAEDVVGGVLVRCPATGLDVERLRRLARCHAAVRPAGAGSCPLWRPDAQVDVWEAGDDVYLEITARPGTAANEIRESVKALIHGARR